MSKLVKQKFCLKKDIQMNNEQMKIAFNIVAHSVQFSSVAQSCPTLCDPMNHSMPGLPVYHKLLEFTQTHAHQKNANQNHMELPFHAHYDGYKQKDIL